MVYTLSHHDFLRDLTMKTSETKCQIPYFDTFNINYMF